MLNCIAGNITVQLTCDKIITQKMLQSLFWYFQEFCDIIKDERDVDSVVVGLAPSKFNHENLSAAFQIIKNKNMPLIAINKSRYFASKEGLKLGTGNFQILILFYIVITIIFFSCGVYTEHIIIFSQVVLLPAQNIQPT